MLVLFILVVLACVDICLLLWCCSIIKNNGLWLRKINQKVETQVCFILSSHQREDAFQAVEATTLLFSLSRHTS